MIIINFLNLVRWKNLLFTIYTLLIIKFIVIKTLLNYSLLSNYQFIIYTFLIILIMAGGYLINNMYDYKIDKINKPESYLFSKTHSLNNVKSAYWIIIGLSVILIIYFSFIINNLYAAIIFISSIFLLNLYARKLKSFGLIGNLLIAFLIALNFILINYFEFNLYSKNKNENMLVSILFLLTYFSFILNLAREIIKDIQDIKGDYQYGVKSLPITLGIASSYKIVSILCSIATISLIVLIALSSLSIILNIYLYLFCIIPLGYLSLKLWQSTKFNKASNFSKMLKIIMFFGINSLLIIAFTQ